MLVLPLPADKLGNRVSASHLKMNSLRALRRLLSFELLNHQLVVDAELLLLLDTRGLNVQRAIVIVEHVLLPAAP